MIKEGYGQNECSFYTPYNASYVVVYVEVKSESFTTHRISGYPVTQPACEVLVPIRVYPNPIADVVNIDIPTDNTNAVPSSNGTQKTYEIRLLDTFGVVRKTFLRNTDGQTLSFDVSDLPNGVYFLQVVGASINQTTKIIIGGTVAN